MRTVKLLKDGAFLFALTLTFASCGNLDNPLEGLIPSNNSGEGGGSSVLNTYIVYTAPGVCSNVTIPSDAIEWNFVSGDVPAGTYKVSKDFTSTGELILKGDVSIILMDNATLTVENGITAENADLAIYAQSTGSSKGALKAKNNTPNHTINATNTEAHAIVTKNVTIYGGEIEARGDTGPVKAEEASAGLYGISSLTIYDGNINAAGGAEGAGISSESVIISGGKVVAEGGLSGAGIYATGGITISGTTTQVNATGGDSDGTHPAGPGIYTKGNITVDGGTIFAQGGNGVAGCPSGVNAINVASPSPVTFSGGSITAIGGDAATGGDGSYGIYIYGELRMTGASLLAQGKVKGEGGASDGHALYYASLSDANMHISACNDGDWTNPIYPHPNQIPNYLYVKIKP